MLYLLMMVMTTITFSFFVSSLWTDEEAEYRRSVLFVFLYAICILPLPLPLSWRWTIPFARCMYWHWRIVAGFDGPLFCLDSTSEAAPSPKWRGTALFDGLESTEIGGD